MAVQKQSSSGCQPNQYSASKGMLWLSGTPDSTGLNKTEVPVTHKQALK